MTTRSILLLTYFTTVLLTQAQENKNITKINELSNIIERLTLDNKTAGIAFGIQIGDTNPITKEYGLADLSEKMKVGQHHQFRIASITKPFTATAILKLVEAKKISLDDNLQTFFPDYPNGKNISIYQLLSHTSGIPDWWDGELPKNAPENFPMCPNPHKYLQQMKKNSFFAPGEFYSYSNSGYVLLGEIIEKITGKAYHEFLHEQVFSPVGMSHTEMEFIEKSSSDWVKGYAIDTTKTARFVEPEVYHMPFAAGGLRSTTLDLMMFIKAFNSGKIVSEQSVDTMTSYALLKSGKPVYKGKYSPNNPGGPNQEEKIGYGLGFKLREQNQVPIYYHDGGIAGFQSYMLHVPKNNTTIVLLANTEYALVQVLKEIRRVAIEIEN